MTRERIDILCERCTGCGLCENACPFGAISILDRKAVIDEASCTLCGACASICRHQEAIRITVDHRSTETGIGEVWVLAEKCAESGGGLTSVSEELLGGACKLAEQLQVKVGAVLIGSDLAMAAAAATALGADTVYLADHGELNHFRDEPYAAVLAAAIRRYRPEILLGGATPRGRALLPRVAVMVKTGLTADCTQLEIEVGSGLLLQTRPAFGGNLLATISCEERRPQMATVRPGVLPRPAVRRVVRPTRTVRLKVPASSLESALSWVNFRPCRQHGPDLREAEIIVAVGRGAGGPAGVKLAAELAVAIGGCLGASRAAVDAGWVEYPYQVGQTGTTVQPKIYLACGISGAIQHLVGMQNSETIIAINKDGDAPIFNYADIAVVGDLLEILPQLIKQIDRHSDDWRMI